MGRRIALDGIWYWNVQLQLHESQCFSLAAQLGIFEKWLEQVMRCDLQCLALRCAEQFAFHYKAPQTPEVAYAKAASSDDRIGDDP